jgi:hypothetical protein
MFQRAETRPIRRASRLVPNPVHMGTGTSPKERTVSHNDAISYHLPALSSRFAVKLNPHYSAETDRAANAWAWAQFGAGRDLPMPVRLDNFTVWAALAYPRADAATLMNWCRFNAMFTMIENLTERSVGSERLDSSLGLWDVVTRALYRMAVAEDPRRIAREASSRHEVQQSLLMCCSLVEGAPRHKTRRFFHAIARMTQAQRDEPMTLQSAAMDFENYVDYRAGNYGILLFIAGAHLMLQQEMSDAEWNHPARSYLDALVARQCCLVNDLYSFHKELRERGNRGELVQAVSVLMRGEELTAQQAVDRLVQVIRGYEDEYVRVRDSLLARPGASAGLREYCEKLEDIMSGNLRYMLISPRYYGAGFTGEFRGGTCTVEPMEELAQAA